MRHIHLALLAMILAACGTNNDPGLICTEIGCNSGIAVVLETPPSLPYRVEVYAPGSSKTRYVHDCPTQSSCTPGIFFQDFTPDRVIVEVITASGTQRHEAMPIYSETQPNGPGCPPVCRNAMVRI